MIAGIGTDILEIARMAKGMRSSRFIARVFTPEESEYCAGRPIETAAGLFAAKEACVKAAGSGFAGFWPCDVEISHDTSGRPVVRPRGKFEDICESMHIRLHVSISHSKDTVIAAAVAETANGGPL